LGFCPTQSETPSQFPREKYFWDALCLQISDDILQDFQNYFLGEIENMPIVVDVLSLRIPFKEGLALSTPLGGYGSLMHTPRAVFFVEDSGV